MLFVVRYLFAELHCTYLYIEGTEIAGEVLEVGKDVSGLSPGDIVVGLVEGGGLQEIITVPSFMADLVRFKAILHCIILQAPH